MVRESVVPSLSDKKKNLLETHVRVLTGHFDKLQADYAAIMEQQHIHETVMKGVKGKIEGVTERVDQHEEKIDALESARAELQAQMAILKSTVADCHQEILRLGGRGDAIQWPPRTFESLDMEMPALPVPTVPVRSPRRKLQKYPSPRS